jgi:hypothetical protein
MYSESITDSNTRLTSSLSNFFRSSIYIAIASRMNSDLLLKPLLR